MEHTSDHSGLTGPAPTAEPSPAQQTGRLSPYLAVWTGLGAVGLLYVTVALAVPQLLPSSDANGLDLPLPSATTQDTSQTSLEEKLARMERDLNKQAKSDVKGASQQSHLDRIAALEAKAQKAEAETEASGDFPVTGMPLTKPDTDPFSTTTADTTPPNSAEQAAHEIADRLGGAKILNDPAATVPNTTTVVKQAAKTAAAEQAKTTATEVTTAALQSAKPSAQPSTKAAKAAEKAPVNAVTKPAPPKKKVAAQKKPASKPPIKTGSVGKAASQPITFGPAVVTRATRPIGVRIATGPSVDSLRLSWNAISDRYGPAIARLQPRYVTGIGAGGLTYDLIAGPFNTQSEASDVCARLHANGARCALGEFTGNAL